MSEFTKFSAVYDELTDEVSRARYEFFPGQLSAWFENLDETPMIADVVTRLYEGQNFDSWYETVQDNGGSFVGSATLEWPEGRNNALGMKLLLFRACANKKLDISDLGFNFIYVGNNINDNARAIVEQVFMPTANELRRHLQREVSKLEDAVPASDRIVHLYHNRPDYNEAVHELDRLITTLREANDYVDLEEKDQRIAEVSAARRLMDAVNVRIEPMVSLLRPLFQQYTTTLKNSLIATAVSSTIAALSILFGKIF